MTEIFIKSAGQKCLSVFLLALIVLGLSACGGEESLEPEITRDAVMEETQEAQQESPDSQDYDTGSQYTYKASDSLRELPQITSIRIATLSPDLRDGFKALVETDSADSDEVDFIYEWKLNGQEIIGVSDHVIEWQEGFSKGDTLSVSVIPLSEAGQGVWAAEGSMLIPNSPPEIVSEPGSLFDSGEFSYTVEAVDSDGDSFDFTLRGAPRGMTIEPATGLITWVYDSDDSGDYEVLIVVTDSEGAQSVQTLNFTIREQDSTL